MTGRLAGDEVATPGHWVEQARRTVRFGDAVRSLVAEGVATVLEVGPNAQLATLVPDILAEPVAGGARDVVAAATLRPGRDETEALVAALAEVWVRGAPVDWRPLFPGARRVDLPTYAFQHRRYWPSPSPTPAASAVGAATGGDIDPDAIVDGWRYRVVWKPAPVTPTVPAPGPTRWILVTSTGVPDAVNGWCAGALTGRGAEVVVRPVGAATDRSALHAQLADAAADGPVTGVLSLLGIDEGLHPGAGGVTVGLAGTVALVQALGDAALDAPLWCLTRGAVATGRSAGLRAVRPEQAAVWGLGRVVGLEHPDRWGGLIDLPPDLDDVDGLDGLDGDRMAAALHTALHVRDGEDQLALRPEGLLVRRMVEAPAPPRATASGPAWSTSGTALVTGGTGGLGRHVARWLVERGAEHVVLASRRGAEAPGATEVVAEVEAAGGRATLVACDVADRGELDELVGAVPDDRPLRTIVHCAGSRLGGELTGIDTAHLAEAMAAKAGGARHLDELAEEHGLDLDAFVLFSSGAGVWGGGAQGAYAAANAFLDGLVERRRARGRPATSLAWGLWAGDGMGAGATGDQLHRWGVREMAPDLALLAFGQALEEGEPCLAVADIDWPRFAPSFSAARRRPLIEDLPAAVRALDPDLSTPPASGRGDGPDRAMAADEGASVELERRLAGLDPAARHEALVELVLTEVAAVLGHGSAAAVDPERTFKDLGFDSVTAVELRNRLQAVTGLRLPATLVFDHPRPEGLAHELASLVAPHRSAGADALRHLSRIEAALATNGTPAGEDGHDAESLAQLRIGLRRLLSRLDPTATRSAGEGRDDAEDTAALLHEADDDVLLAFIDRELG
jgi:acyl transferase domain-containing protein/acyl carrier protein